MAQTRFDIILTGRLLENADRDQVAQRLAALFKLDPAKAANLLAGKPHRIKQGADEATARRFRDAIRKAGAEVAVKKLAPSTSKPASPSAPAAGGNLELAPQGTPVLRDSERAKIPEPDIDTSALTLAELEPWEGSGELVPEPVEAPDFGVAEPGAELETLPDERPKLNPDTSALSLDEPGATLGTPGKKAPPPPDTSHIKLEKNNPFL